MQWTENQTMTIRKCPQCAQLTHIDKGERAPLFCWNCAARVDFGAPSRHLLAGAAIAFDRALSDPSSLVRVGAIALVAAVPVAALMLLLCNAFDIFVVRDAAAPFLMR